MDNDLVVRIPTMLYEGFLSLTSLLLWMEGIFFIVAGTAIYHTLKIFFLDDSGITSSGKFAYMMIGFGTASFLASGVTLFVIYYPSMLRYAGLVFYYSCSLLFVATIFAYSSYYLPNIREQVKHGFANIMHNYNAIHSINGAVNGLQQTLGCCGTDNFTSWFETSWANRLERVPASCCIRKEQCHNLEPLALADIYTRGCYPQLDSGTLACETVFVGTLVGNILFLGIAICVAIQLGRRYQRIKEDSLLPLVSR